MKERSVYLFLSMFLLSLSANAFGQFASIPQGGIAPYLDYQHSDIDSVNLSNGNVNLHIPLVSFPQLGSKLQLSFIIRFNSPKWVVNGVTSALNWSTGKVQYEGWWDLQRSGVSAPSPVGVDVVRDQGITADTSILTFMCVATDGSGPGNCDDGVPAWQEAVGPFYTNSTRFSVRDRTGAEHSVGQYGTEPLVGPVSQFSTAPDGSGWTAVAPSQWGSAPTVYYDRNGLRYKNIGTNGLNLWQTADPDGNTITTTTNGWTDTVGRTIAGSWSGPGNGLTQVNSGAIPQSPMEDDPFPGTATTNTAGCASGATAARVWQVPYINGSTATYKFCYTPQNVATQFNVTTMAGGPAGVVEATATGLLLTQVLLPNNTSYSFSYDNYFDLISVTLPTGGTISYSWTTIPWDGLSTAQPVVRAIKSRTVAPGNGSAPETWNYTWSTTQQGIYVGEFAVTANVTKPDGNDETHFGGFVAKSSVKYYQGSSPANPNGKSGSLLRIESTTNQLLLTPFSEPLPAVATLPSSGIAPPYDVYSSPWSFQDPAVGPPTSKTVTLDNGAVSQEVYSPIVGTTECINFGENTSHGFNSNIFSQSCQSVDYGLDSSVAEYDFGTTGSGTPGTLLRTTTTTYKWNDGTSAAASYLAANLLDLPSKVVTTNGSGAWMSETDYGYDESPSPAGALGNLTSTTHVLSQGTSPKTRTQYNAQGMPTAMFDAKGNETSISSYQCSGLFPQNVIQAFGTPIAETTTYSYDCTLGKLNSVTDPNLKTTNYFYNDPLARLTEVQYPDGGDKQVNYNGDPVPPVVTLTTKEGAAPITNKILYDGLGRTTETQLTSDPGGAVLQDTTYDPVGRIQSTSNPYRTKGDATYGITSYLYDGLGRKTYQCQPDNTTAPSTTCVPTNSYQSWSYNGNVTTFTDENGNQWQRTTDALGRLTQVLEPSATSASPTLATGYAYDANNNLLKVTQSGVSGTDAARVRTFTYDSLSRLLCASNPESSNSATPQVTCPASATSPLPAGTLQYSYDANGNVSSKTDTRGITVNYGYDALNRLLSKSSAGYLSSCFQYDGSASNNQVGRLVYEWTQTGTCPTPPALPSAGFFTLRSITSYDPMGRVKGEQQCVPGNCTTSSGPALGYTYDLAGDPTTLTNSVGAAGGPLTLTNSFDTGAHLSSVVSGWTSYPTCLYVLGTNSGSTCSPASTPYGYGPVGPVQWTHGSNLTVTQGYDNRLRVNSIAAQGQVP